MATQKRRKKRKKNLTGGELLAFRVLMAACAVLLCISTVRNLTAGGAKKAAGQVSEETALSGMETEGGDTASARAETGDASYAAAVTPEPTATPTPDPYADKPDIDINSWEYVLANPWNSIEDYYPDVVQIEDIEVDYRIYDAMEAFVSDCRAAGNTVYLSSGYRSYDLQSYLFEKKCQEYDEETAATIVARPGTSEHQTGIAADITEEYYEYKSAILEDTAMYQWMEAHCQEYGFIVRFPDGKEDITGIIYEPWHFRYVGVEAATYIMEHNLTLEEFVALYKDDVAGADTTALAGDSYAADDIAEAEDADTTGVAAETDDTDVNVQDSVS
jgi:LAS superfamily LD-carboxypeptidase LdcB